ncbi:MerR family transcriptional regulator [Paraburkholderia agricolaris]|uniref:helix-turn-helix domain-containing protein n=1 Tax=Paraburkholderia agricolaris TaxID=2152888 RepID=UPI0038BB7D47
MWIGEFAKRTGLSVSTVRFYVRTGLLFPKVDSAGGSRPYMRFSEQDLRLAAAIRAGQTLGLSLTEVKSLIDGRRAGKAGDEKMLQMLVAQRKLLGHRVRDLNALIRFVDAKIIWLHAGKAGPAPEPPVTSAKAP